MSDIIIDQNQIPRTINQDHLQTASCGHVIRDKSDILGVCDFGHVVCKREKLYRCAHCDSIMCDLELNFDENGLPICPKHSPSIDFSTIGIIIFIIGVIIYGVCIK